jgi:undecaprenyl pyrophosphate synthase
MKQTQLEFYIQAYEFEHEQLKKAAVRLEELMSIIRMLVKELEEKKQMKDFVQGLIDGLDKTTEAGFAEALLIAISNLKNEQGLLLNVRLSDDTKQSIDFAMQIAQMMLSKGDK